MILIVGCGFLGSYLVRHIRSSTDEKIIATVRSTEGLTDDSSVKYIRCDVSKKEDIDTLASFCGDEELTVFYLAACHNIDYVYENPAEAEKINIEALSYFLSRMTGIKKLFFASTDCVYGESGEGLCKENSPLNPVNEYGRQKIRAERLVTEKGFTALRFPFMLGPSLIAAKKHFYDRIVSDLEQGKEIRMIDGMRRSVISYSQASELVYKLSVYQGALPEKINICSDYTLSKYEMGCELAKSLKLPIKSVKKISEQEGESFFKDKRASCTAMDNSLLKALLGIEKIKWEV